MELTAGSEASPYPPCLVAAVDNKVPKRYRNNRGGACAYPPCAFWLVCGCGQWRLHTVEETDRKGASPYPPGPSSGLWLWWRLGKNFGGGTKEEVPFTISPSEIRACVPSQGHWCKQTRLKLAHDMEVPFTLLFQDEFKNCWYQQMRNPEATKIQQSIQCSNRSRRVAFLKHI